MPTHPQALVPVSASSMGKCVDLLVLPEACARVQEDALHFQSKRRQSCSIVCTLLVSFELSLVRG